MSCRPAKARRPTRRQARSYGKRKPSRECVGSASGSGPFWWAVESQRSKRCHTRGTRDWNGDPRQRISRQIGKAWHDGHDAAGVTAGLPHCMGLGWGRMVMVGGSLVDHDHMPVMGLVNRRPIRSLGDRIQRGAREAEGNRHDEQAAKHEANAGHSTFLGGMAETPPPAGSVPNAKDPAVDLLGDCHFAFNFEIRRVGCRKATFFALKGEMPIRFVRCSLIPACERGAVSGARYDRRWRANGLPCDRSGARRPWQTLSGPVSSPSQPAARPCKRCLTFRGKNLDFIGKISHLAARIALDFVEFLISPLGAKRQPSWRAEQPMEKCTALRSVA